MAGIKRILVVDDDPNIRNLLRIKLERDGDLVVVGEAGDGAEAVQLVEQLKPDLITMDIDMPRMDGLSAIREIMPASPLPILVCTSLPAGPDTELLYQAIEAGAAEIIQKPLMDGEAIRNLVRELAGTTMPRATASTRPAPSPPSAAVACRVVCMAGSGSASAALSSILSGLTEDFPATIAVVQHLPAGFKPSFADYLQKRTSMRIRVLEHEAELDPGCVYIAPDDKQMVVSNDHVAAVDAPPYDGRRPSANTMLKSVAKAIGRASVGIVLTGAGRDGADGIVEMHRHGALTIAQDPNTVTASAMPEAAVKTGAVSQVLPVEEIAPFLLAVAGASEQIGAR